MVGRKVQIRGQEAAGFGEVESSADDGTSVRVRFYTGPNTYMTTTAKANQIQYDRPLPAQTRCFVNRDLEVRIGRLLGPMEVGPGGTRSYWVQLPNQRATSLPEDRFHVIGYRGEADPVASLANLGHETPFFAVRRLPLFSNLLAQHALMKGMTGLAAARIELFEHQVEVSRRVLLDPKMRYLLADEVGLGKTIEAGIILAQLARDSEDLRAAVYAPQALCAQWQEELERRFSLTEIPVLGHHELVHSGKQELDILVVDEAHRFAVQDSHKVVALPDLREHLRSLALRTPRVLLLTATPILGRDKELLSLLSVLDPESFSETNLAAFQTVLGLRQEIGRSLMALENVSMSSMIRSQVGRVHSLLPHDVTVSDLAKYIGQKLDLQDREGAKAQLAELRLHLSETYRVHHRMLRTRRKSLTEGQGIGAQRLAQAVEFDLEDTYQRIWELVEEYRIIIAARTSEANTAEKAIEFLKFAELITTSPSEAAEMCEYIRQRSELPPDATVIAMELASLLRAPKTLSTRFELLQEVLAARLSRDATSKLVVFCTNTETAAKLANQLAGTLAKGAVATVDCRHRRDDLESEVQRFRDEVNCRVLISDGVLEEGRNLQFASGLILFDIPFSPMRLEQRIGRLDRLDRIEPIPIKAILTLDDQTLALDTAWYNCLVKGFGIFEAPISDLQLLIEDELPRFAEQLFRGGAPAISSRANIEQLRQRIQRERERISEQDIVDGLRLDSRRAKETWDEVQKAEQLSAPLTKYTESYLRDSLRLNVHFHREGPGITYSLREREEPLVPIDRLLFLTTHANREFTASRPRAARHEECELLRSGHQLVEGIVQFLKWDDRGRAFAFWRRAPLLSQPALVFRIWVVVSVDTNAIDKQLDTGAYDELGRATLRRLLGAWFSPRILDFCLDAFGRPISPKLIKAIAPAYDNEIDINLGGKRSHALIEAFGEKEWPATCKLVADVAIQEAKVAAAVSAAIAFARNAVTEHFQIANLRLTARSRAGADTGAQSSNRQLELAELHDDIDACMGSPTFKIDTLGAYVLSAEPICAR